MKEIQEQQRIEAEQLLRDRNLNENENFESVEVKCTADDDINLNETNPAIEPAKVFEIWNRFLFAKQILRRQQLLGRVWEVNQSTSQTRPGNSSE